MNLYLFNANQRTEYEQLLIDTDEYESLQYKAVDKVIALSDNMKNFLFSEYQLEPYKVTVIPNGLEDVLIDNGQMTIDNAGDTDKIALREKWHLSANESIILFAGRLHPIKGLTFLINAFCEILKIIPNCRLIIAGGGRNDMYRKEAEDISSQITFTGLLDKKALYELYQIADIGVVPSLYEPFGLVALEMMMHGLPIVATATSGLNEVVDDTCGLKTPVIEHPDRVEVDTDLLAEKILYLSQHSNEARTMGQNGRKRYLREYTSEVFRRNMLNLYRLL
jgi:glycosyltransferase involved in cell wall biosynthesis